MIFLIFTVHILRAPFGRFVQVISQRPKDQLYFSPVSLTCMDDKYNCINEANNQQISICLPTTASDGTVCGSFFEYTFYDSSCVYNLIKISPYLHFCILCLARNQDEQTREKDSKGKEIAVIRRGITRPPLNFLAILNDFGITLDTSYPDKLCHHLYAGVYLKPNKLVSFLLPSHFDYTI